MSHRIRRNSMEHLELYDLDKLKTNPSTNYQLTSQISSSYKHHQHRYSLINPQYERYPFLCNIKRSKIDPIYAATPMFTTIPQSSNEESYQQFIDSSYIPLENVKPLSRLPSKSSTSKNIGIVENEKGKDKNDNDQSKHDDCKEIIEKIFNRQ
ncbi:unnamed protein product [Rotaria sp. Silwood2]|nr:unnamed protein product [Rotaria sp. Silwood2]CAF2863325.1 unnamed protein product [Rotaria sp. Silwood2]CAF3126770.1 unnamed protein product [Rotaria sp. Silwood2]CAF3273577.1 unnamed protein product [Rotaria sp. Silwood2]CAF4208692.1 unnamed protein product [Rotaria sp. Silwood2]